MVGNFPSAVRQIISESGWGKLYEGLPSILFRQISFGMMKFLVFDFFSGALIASVFQPHPVRLVGATPNVILPLTSHVFPWMNTPIGCATKVIEIV